MKLYMIVSFTDWLYVSNQIPLEAESKCSRPQVAYKIDMLSSSQNNILS
jgi:hypothetical protein